jgi:hypothetical protein
VEIPKETHELTGPRRETSVEFFRNSPLSNRSSTLSAYLITGETFRWNEN